MPQRLEYLMINTLKLSQSWEIGSLFYIHMYLYLSGFLRSSTFAILFLVYHYTRLLDFGHTSADFSLVLFPVSLWLVFTQSVFMQCSFTCLTPALYYNTELVSRHLLTTFCILHFCQQIFYMVGNHKTLDHFNFDAENFGIS